MILTIANQKGGVGKTTTAVNLSVYLSLLHQKVLLIDFDPQGNATCGLGFDKLDSLYKSFIYNKSLSSIVLDTKFKNLSFIPTDQNLAALEIELVDQENREFILKSLLEDVISLYDFIVIDCPPSLGLLTINSLVAAEKVLIPIQSEFYALEGLSHLLGNLARVKKHLNNSLDILGLLVTMVDRRTILSHQIIEEVKKHFPNKTFKTIIPRNVRLAEAPSFGQPIAVYDRFSKGARAYKALAKEVIQRSKI